MDMDVPELAGILEAIKEDETYKAGVAWGRPRIGHPEGRISDHISELERNLEKISDDKELSSDCILKLEILIHVHDTLKYHATPRVPIEHPQSHASLAAEYLRGFTDDEDLIAMVQYHDEGYALYKQEVNRGGYNKARLQTLVSAIKDLRLFLIFNLIDNCTDGKTSQPVRWYLGEIRKLKPDIEIDETWVDVLGR